VAAALLDEVRKVGFSMPSYVDLEVSVRVAVAVGTPAALPQAKLETQSTTLNVATPRHVHLTLVNARRHVTAHRRVFKH
jgi:hypothetical protein